jgi:hypothetical protein
MTGDKTHANFERHIREVYTKVPVPVDGIWQRVRTQPSGRPRTPRIARVARDLAVFSAVVIAITVAVLLPRLERQPNGTRVVGGPSAPAVAPSASTPSPLEGVADCSLPIAWVGDLSGFFNVRTGVFTPAPAGGESYARALGKWVSVPTQQVAPDGSAYTFVATTGRVNALYITDARGRHLVASSSGPVTILGFVSLGVAYTAPDRSGNLKTWLVDATGAPARMTGDGHTFMWAGGNALWRIRPAIQGLGIALYRLDLITNHEQVWLDVDQYLGPEPSLSPVPTRGSEGVTQTPEDNLHHSLGIVGFDQSGNPVVELGAAGAQSLSATLLITGPQDVIAIVPPGPNSPGHFVPVNAVGGAAAVWMVDFEGDVAEHLQSGTTSVVGKVPVPANSYAQLAGPCG